MPLRFPAVLSMAAESSTLTLSTLFPLMSTNHWFDPLVGSAVAASMQRVMLFGTDRNIPEKRNRSSFKEMQGRRRG
jgi:hypothetical protein